MIQMRSITSPTSRLRAGGIYFIITFLVGSVLGPARELLLAPKLGYDRALAIEMVIMLLVSAAAAQAALRRSAIARTGGRLAMGLVAAGLLVMAEELLARLLSGDSIFTIWASQSPEAQTMTVLLMFLFAIMPALVARRRMATTAVYD